MSQFFTSLLAFFLLLSFPAAQPPDSTVTRFFPNELIRSMILKDTDEAAQPPDSTVTRFFPNELIRSMILKDTDEAAQPPDSTVTRYFPTELTRSMILKDAVGAADVAGGAHFKAVYTPKGELLSVEYVPAPGDRSRRGKKVKKAPGITLYYRHWNEVKRELKEGLTRKDIRGQPHYRATLDKQGRIQRVAFYDNRQRLLWTYHMIWSPDGTRTEYEVEFHLRRPLTALDGRLFAPALSEMRPGWRARYHSLEDGRPVAVEVYDRLGQLYYFYRFDYQPGVIVSAYSRPDSTLVGRHKLFFQEGALLQRVEYYNPRGILIRSREYQRQSDQTIVTLRDGAGRVLERRIIPSKEPLIMNNLDKKP